MLIYNLNLITVYISSTISRIFKQNTSTKTTSYIFIGIAFASMLIVSGYRYYVGTDFSNYQYMFMNIYKEELITQEAGYILLNKIAYKINPNPQTIFIVTSLIILLLVFVTIGKYCSRYELGLYLFITLFHYYASFNVIRQYIAIAITFYSVRYIFEKKFYKYLLSVIIASTFHLTAIIMIPFYFIAKIPMGNREYIYGSIIGIMGLSLFEKIYTSAIDLFPKYEGYRESVLFSYGSTTGVVVYGIIFIVVYIFRKKLIQLDNRNMIYIKFIFVSFLVSILAIKGVLFARITGFFNIYAVILIPNLIDLFNKKEKKIVYYSILCIGYVYCYLTLKSGQADVLPYRFRPI